MRQAKSVVSILVGCAFCLAAMSWTASGQEKVNPKLLKRGEYLVGTSMCHDCHTPLIMGPNGPERDMKHMLSGHPQELVMPPAPTLPPGPWMASFSATMTAWSGPWGVSFTRNLTPDKETGLGDWTEDNFISTIRNGRQLGKGRALLPPMPYDVIGKMTDEDLKAIFAYLRTIPALKNKVPEPIAPAPPPPGVK